MLVAGAFEHPHRALQKLRVGFRVFAELAACVSQEKLGVLFVGQAVGRDVVGAKRDCSREVCFPLSKNQSWSVVSAVGVPPPKKIVLSFKGNRLPTVSISRRSASQNRCVCELSARSL